MNDSTNNNIDTNTNINNTNNGVEPVLPQGNASNTPIMAPEAPAPTPIVETTNVVPAASNVSQTVTETPIVQAVNNNEVVQTPIENVMPQTLINETKNENSDSQKPKKKRHFLRSFFSFIITLAFFGWICILGYDFYNITNKNEPKFCIEKGTIKNDDGTVDWCLGAGYKTYHYDYKEYEAFEFGPFWQEAKTLEEIKNK